MPTPDLLFTILSAVGSTNNYAMAKVHEGVANYGQAYFCSNQTEGKGQRGKRWETATGLNIALSIVLDVQMLKASQQFQLSVAVALGCYDFFAAFAGEETRIKWPNDIYWRDKKAGGILIETIFSGQQWKYAVAGIGLNINQTTFDIDLQNPVSLQQITGKSFNLELLARDLHQKVLLRYDNLLKGNFADLLQEYNQHLFGLDKISRLKKDTIVFDTTIVGVSEYGQLLTVDTMERQFNFGEVAWVL